MYVGNNPLKKDYKKIIFLKDPGSQLEITNSLNTYAVKF